MKKRALSILLTFILILSSTTLCPANKANAQESNKTATQELEDLFTTIDLMDATIVELQDEMTAGNLTSEQLTQMYIDRIKAYDEKLKLNSIISINPSALSDAAALDKERADGKVRGPLHGVPIVVKANYDVKGMATSAGSGAFAGMIADKDSFAVKKLRDSGAVIIAQANLSEFATSAVDSSSTLGGVVHNAYDGTKTPAGSSGGTAVAVTCNFAAAGLGTDTGGSIRNPSSFSNLYGIRPSKGLTSINGVVPLVASRDTTGPMARTAEDMALVLESIAGTDAGDDFTVEANADKLLGAGYTKSLTADSLKGKRIGFIEFSFAYKDYVYPDYDGDDGDEGYDDGDDSDDGEDGDDDDDEDDEEEPLERLVYPDAKTEAMINKTMANLRKGGVEFVDLSDELPADSITRMGIGASDESFEYDLNKYLHEKGSIAPYKTLKDIILNCPSFMYSYLANDVIDSNALADSFEETENPYIRKIGSYDRLPTWEQTLEYREKVSQVMKENDIDAIMYLSYMDLPFDVTKPVATTYNYNGYEYVFGPALGLPEMSLPMGFGDTNDEYTSETPLGIYLFSSFGNEKALMEIAYGYEKQAGDYIRRMPERTPALTDNNLNSYLEELIEKAYSIDYSEYNKKPVGKVQMMLNACEAADSVDTDDPYVTYKAAKKLAKAYDKVMAALEESGRVPGKSSEADVKTGTKITFGNLNYKVTSVKNNNRTVAVTGMKNKSKTVVNIPATITINKIKYKVTAINAKAFKSNSKIKKVTIGSNVKTIGKLAFAGCSNLKTITVKSNVLKKVYSKALKGINKKAVIKVPSKKKKAYKNILKKKGQAKTVKIK